MKSRPPSKTPRSKPTAYILIPVFVMLAMGIVAAGAIYYRAYRARYRAEVERQLSAVAELKVRGLTQWRRERLADGAVFFKNRNFSDRVRRYLETPDDPEARERMMAWLRKFQEGYEYSRVYLLDARGAPRMSVPESDEPVDPNLSQAAPEVLKGGRIVFLDFHRDSPGSPVHLAILVPVLDVQTEDRPLGLLVFRIDPAAYLYPFTGRWPTPSRTAETLLVRREEAEVVFLNDLRFHQNAALELRFPMERKELPAVKAALGRESVEAGVDYRGVPVLAATRSVPDSPWSLVARMDLSEVYAPVKERLWLLVFLIATLIAGAGAGVGLISRQQRLRFYRESEERYRSTLDGMLEGCQIIDRDFRYVYINEMAAIHGQRKKEELLGQRMTDLYPGIEKTAMFAALRRSMEERMPHRMENEFTYPDGGRAWFELSIQPVPEGIFVLSLDITERKAAEEKLTASLQEKELLLREIHHRVKNNMQVISSLLRLQSRSIEDEKMRGIFNESQSRIQSMALIHQKLYESKDFSRIDFSDYIVKLITHLLVVYSADEKNVRIKVEAENVDLDITRAIPCGLIINELVSNALKYAFRGEKKGELIIRMNRDKTGRYSLTVKDTGIGLPENFDFRKAETLGFQIVTDLVKQLDGSMEITTGEGTEIRIVF